MKIFKAMNNDKRIITRVARMLKIFVLGVMAVMTSSCEDFLSISPTDKIVEKDFWKTKSDVDNAVAESYRLMTQRDFTYRLIVWGELRGDNVIAGENVGLDIENILEANLLPTNEYASWAPYYKVINNCNQVLEYAPRVLSEDPDFTEGELKVVSGQMLALRALCHFYLVRTFRDIPLLTVAMVKDSQDFYLRQADPIEVLDTCLNDLYRAEELVLTSGNYTDMQENKGRITKDAVRAIIADVCLWKAAFCAQRVAEVEADDKADEKAKADAIVAAAQVQPSYDKCVEYCNLVLNARMAYATRYFKENPKNGIELHESYPLIYPILPKSGAEVAELEKRFPNYPYYAQFGGSNGCNNPYESIFELQHNTRSENGNYEVPYFYGYVPGEQLTTFNVAQLSASRYLAVLKDGLYKRGDFRRVDYINSQSADAGDSKYAIIKFGHSSTKDDRSGLEGDNPEYNFGKMSYTFLKGSSYFTEDQVNWIVYRIPDVMLMKAEALAFSTPDDSKLAEAYKLVESVYNRSQVGYLNKEGKVVGVRFPESGSDYLKAGNYVGAANVKNLQRLILDERQREFAYEGKRWYDLVRMAVRQNSTTEMLGILLNNKYDSNHDEYKMKMSSISSLFFPIAEREIDTHPGLKQNEAFDIADNYQQNN